MERPAPRTGRLHVDAASDNSWKTWAGRTEGAPGFAFFEAEPGASGASSVAFVLHIVAESLRMIAERPSARVVRIAERRSA